MENEILKNDYPLEKTSTTDTFKHTDTSHLVNNATSAILAALELHNKPIFPYRYEIVITVTINAWELLMKAFICEFHPEIKLTKEGWHKSFEECVGFINDKLGKKFLPTKESLLLLYKYRCEIIHYYSKEIDSILYLLLRPNILFFNNFLQEYFEMDLANEVNLIILPIGFKPIISPVDYFNKNLVEGNDYLKNFIKDIISSAESLQSNGIEDGIICNYSMLVEKETNIKNADLIVGVTTDPSKSSLSIIKSVKVGNYTFDENAPKIKIDETSIFTNIFTMSSKDFFKKLKSEVPTFKENSANMTLVRDYIKADANCYRKRYLDISPTSKSVGKGFYSEHGLQKAITLLTPKTTPKSE